MIIRYLTKRRKKFLFITFLLLVFRGSSYSQWVQTNGPYGGFINSLAVNSQGYIFAGTYSGIYLSTNNGEKWTQVNKGLKNTNITSLATSGRIILAGTRDGAYLSTNNGESWTQVDKGMKNAWVHYLAVSGKNIYAGTSGGVYLSTNSGESWTEVNNGLKDANVYSLAISPKNIFAGTLDGSIYISTNNGQSWAKVNNGLSNSPVWSLAISERNVFAGTGDGVYLSTDDGRSWTKINSGLKNTNVLSLAISGRNLFAGTGGGVYLSTNAGNNWTEVNNGLGNTEVLSLAVSGRSIFAGTKEGVYVSTSNGNVWTEVSNGLKNIYVWSLAVSRRNIFAGTCGGGIYLSTDNGESWTKANNGLKNTDILSLAVSGRNIFAGTKEGVYVSTNNGETWIETNNGLKNTIVWCLAISGQDIFAGTLGRGVYLSTNSGKSWAEVNNGLEDTWVWSLAISGRNIYAGTSIGVYLSTNDGESWTQVNNGLTNTDVRCLSIAGRNVFAGTYNGGVYLSTNNGESWTEVNSGLRNTDILSLTISGQKIFAGTDGGGVYFSTNNGKKWVEVGDYPTNTLFTSLAVSEKDIFGGTWGFGVWRAQLGTTTPSYPPQIAASLTFTEPSGNNILDADETGVIKIKLTNKGKGEAFSVGGVVTPNTYDGLEYNPQFQIGDIIPGETKEYTFYVKAKHTIGTGNVPLEFRFNEANGFEPQPVKVVFPTKAFVPPKLIVADVGVRDADGSSIIRPGRVVEITVRVQNAGAGEAKDVNAKIGLGENVFIAEGGSTNIGIGNLTPGEYRDIKFSIYTNNRATEVPVYINLSEHYGLYGTKDIRLPLEFNKVMAQLNEVVVKPKEEERSQNIEISRGLSIDVDREIPHGVVENGNGIALIVAISDYKDTGIPEVKYAKHDGEILREYLIKGLGYKPENILPKNPDELWTYGNIRRYIRSVLPSYLKPDGSSDLFIYYTGHGAPGMENHEAYLVPWDGDPNYVNNDNAYNMKEFYLDIEKLKARQKIIVIDACFSGQSGSGTSLLRNASSAILKVNNPAIADSSTVIFQSSGADQVSNWYDEKRHGMFTYFFLKGLQGDADYNRDGKITGDELIRYINDPNDGLPYYSNRLYQRPQKAQIEGNKDIIIEKITK